MLLWYLNPSGVTVWAIVRVQLLWSTSNEMSRIFGLPGGINFKIEMPIRESLAARGSKSKNDKKVRHGQVGREEL